jgi:hypothetical protein
MLFVYQLLHEVGITCWRLTAAAAQSPAAGAALRMIYWYLTEPQSTDAG